MKFTICILMVVVTISANAQVSRDTGNAIRAQKTNAVVSAGVGKTLRLKGKIVFANSQCDNSLCAQVPSTDLELVLYKVYTFVLDDGNNTVSRQFSRSTDYTIRENGTDATSKYKPAAVAAVKLRNDKSFSFVFRSGVPELSVSRPTVYPHVSFENPVTVVYKPSEAGPETYTSRLAIISYELVLQQNGGCHFDLLPMFNSVTFYPGESEKDMGAAVVNCTNVDG